MTATTRQIIADLVNDPAAVALAGEVVLQDHAQGRVYQGRAEVESLLRAFFVAGFPGALTEIQSITVGKTSTVLERVFHQKQDGPLLGIPSTGHEVVLAMTIVCQISDGQIHSLCLYYDAGGLLRQLGLAL